MKQLKSTQLRGGSVKHCRITLEKLWLAEGLASVCAHRVSSSEL